MDACGLHQMARSWVGSSLGLSRFRQTIAVHTDTLSNRDPGTHQGNAQSHSLRAPLILKEAFRDESDCIQTQAAPTLQISCAGNLWSTSEVWGFCF